MSSDASGAHAQGSEETEIKSSVRSFIVGNFLFGSDDPMLTDDASFLRTGIIDSTGILELVAHVETSYGFVVEDEEMVPENLDSLDNVSRFIGRKLRAREHQHT